MCLGTDIENYLKIQSNILGKKLIETENHLIFSIGDKISIEPRYIFEYR